MLHIAYGTGKAASLVVPFSVCVLLMIELMQQVES